MKFWDREKAAEVWYTIRSNKKRSILTSLGVFFGMFFFTVMLSLGIGLENALNRAISSASSDLHFFDLSPTTKPYQGYGAKRTINITYSDFRTIQQSSHSFKHMAAFRYWQQGERDWRQDITYKGKSIKTMVSGVTEDFFSVISIKIVAGRTIRPEEIEAGLPVCLMGVERAEGLFKEIKDAPGQVVTIGGVSFRIVGVVDKMSAASFGSSPDWTVYIPIKYSLGNDPEGTVFVYGLPKPNVTEDQMKADIFAPMSKKYHIHPDDKGIVMTMSTRILYNFFGMISNGLNILVWLIGMGTLVTGVISVSNILLVTVRERQREIGVRRALGAVPRNIVEQFISESILIISLAGFGGMIIGLMVVLGIGAAAEQSSQLQSFLHLPYPSVGLLLLAALIILVAGVLAGLLPVYKALQIKAIDAIRDE